MNAIQLTTVVVTGPAGAIAELRTFDGWEYVGTVEDGEQFRLSIPLDEARDDCRRCFGGPRIVHTEPTLGEFVAECVVCLNQFDPNLDYRRHDLYGFVAGCWPTTDEPVDVAAQFAESLHEQRA